MARTAVAPRLREKSRQEADPDATEGESCGRYSKSEE
jgi:hypothetical protein